MSVVLHHGSNCLLSQAMDGAVVPLAHASQLSLPTLCIAAFNEYTHDVSSAITRPQTFSFFTFTGVITPDWHTTCTWLSRVYTGQLINHLCFHHGCHNKADG